MAVDLDAVARTARRLVDATANNSPGNRLTTDQARKRVEESMRRGDINRENNHR